MSAVTVSASAARSCCESWERFPWGEGRTQGCFREGEMQECFPTQLQGLV